MPSDALVTVPGSGAAPLTYQIAPAQEVLLKALFATFNGAAAAGPFLPAVRILAPSGQVVGEYLTDSIVAAGASAEVSFFPGAEAGGGAITSQTLVAYSVFAPAAGFVTITSTNSAAPTNVVTSPSFTADGLTQYRIDFGVAAADVQCSGGGASAALIFSLSVDSTILGIVVDLNLPQKAGAIAANDYISIPIYISVFDTPTAGTHTYSIGAYKVLTGGATANCLVYGSNVGPPFTGVTHPGYIAVLQAVVL